MPFLWRRALPILRQWLLLPRLFSSRATGRANEGERVITTIAWDGKTLAADSQSTTGNVRGTAHKLAKSRAGFLVAGSGDFATVKVWINWVVAGMPPDQQPTSVSESNVLVVDPHGRATLFSDVAVAQPLPRKQWAIGSGGDIAMGAMAMGADARQAVKIACKLDVYSGGRIVVLTPGNAT